ncbi:origin recognition complex subunit 2 [Diplodia corticola]|uniref:Origin recognition complex subunit 2 n=1 Tax=Diplodia corticola TaxID=236234 RepID=A0A1J9SG92_9PEZI|nr:origin recognition complex subunit 2 [Diplodia corticola]OJD38828.1 origin recognition complex subunit 2 [Diplodia corticola]
MVNSAPATRAAFTALVGSFRHHEQPEPSPMPSAKRKRGAVDSENTTPRKRRPSPLDETEDDEIALTPSKKSTLSRRQTAAETLNKSLARTKLDDEANGQPNGAATPRSQRRVLFATPSKHDDDEDETPSGTPTIVRNADRSARRKSARRLLQRTIDGGQSDEDVEDEDALARQIWDEEEVDELGEDEEAIAASEPAAVPETPTKRGRGRPKGSTKKKQRSPTPPQDLPPHEKYFWQNRPGGTKTSNNTLPSHALLNHDEYFTQMQKYEDPHEDDIAYLHALHSRSFDQWVYELENGFNICLYGFGSKRKLAEDFAGHLYHHQISATNSTPRIIIINGYNPTLTPKDILTTILTSLLPSSVKLPATPPLLHALLLTTLATKPPPTPLTLITHSLDSASLRRAATQSLFASLASHPHMALLATADTPTFPLLWDLGTRSALRLLFHDCTTFAPFAPVELDAVEAANDLLGRSGRRVQGRDGVGFVLRSLPENARALFRILVAEQLAAGADLDDDAAAAALAAQAAHDDDDADDGDDDVFGFADVPQTPSKRGRGRGAKKAAAAAKEAALLLPSSAAPVVVGVEYRVLYHKAVEEFVCSNEMGFRTLLKEFHDHQMIESRKDGGGAERLWVPFRREDLEGLLEELVE